MNGQQGGDQNGQSSQESHLSYLLNAAGGQAGALLGYHGGLGGAQRLGGYGMGDSSFEEQILQRASALRAEALMQQQQQQQQQAHHRQHHLGAALAALQQQQQQQFSSLAGLNQSHLAGLSPQEQEALLGRAAALRELGISAGSGASFSGVGMERLQQLELGRLEELERRRQQLAALAGFSGGSGGPRPNDVSSGGEQLGHDSHKSDRGRAAEKPPQTAEKTKDELRKTPGTVIVPCRARGMPMDHNFKTAYFVISEDAKHGEDLVCSYFACRNGGVKFRYCAHCMAPVAKRNFCRRHDHGMSAKGELKDDDDDDASMEENDYSTREGAEKPVGTKKGDSLMTSSLDVLSKAASSMPSKGRELDMEGLTKRKKPSEDDDDDDDEPELANISKKRRKMWSALLIKRPRTKDPRHLSSWLNEVLTVSDFETPFEQIDALEAKTPSGGAPSKKHKADKDSQVASPSKKEKKSNGEKKKRKSDKQPSEKVEVTKPKKEKAESSKKKVKSPPKEKLVKTKEPAKPKEPSTPKKEEPKPPKNSEAPKDSVSKPGAKEPIKETAKEEVVKDSPKAETKEEKDGEANGEHKANVSHGDEQPKEVKVAPKDDEAAEEKRSESEKATEADKSEIKTSVKDGAGKKGDDDDGFVGSFADWRDRKKEKAKKGPGSLKN